jgi:hypothetical protein
MLSGAGSASVHCPVTARYRSRAHKMTIHPTLRTGLTAFCAAMLGACATTSDLIPTGLEQQVAHPWYDLQTPAPSTASDLVTGGGHRADTVFVQCMVVQGNGYNWASTLGWMASQVDYAAFRAEQYMREHPGSTVAIDFDCMTGSSSGGASSRLFDTLLSNPSLAAAGDRDGRRLVSSEEAHELASALVFLALSADFRNETFGLATSAIGAWLGLADRRSRGAPASFWRAKSTPTRNDRIFGHWINAAYHYEPSWFDELVGDDPFSIPTFARRSLDLGHDRDHVADERMRFLSSRARRILDDNTRGKSPAPVPTSDGFCVTALAVPLDGNGMPFALEDLILIVVCNEQTYRELATGTALPALLAPSHQMSSRLRIAYGDDWHALLNLTVREPELITPLSGRLLEPPIALQAMAAFDGTAMASITPTDDHLVLGGFAGPRLQAWTATAILAQRVAAFQTEGVTVEGRVAIFGLDENRADPTSNFAQRTIASFFTLGPDPTSVDADVDVDPDAAAETPPTLLVYYAWQDEYCRVSDAHAGEWLTDFFRMNWNLEGSPAAMVGRSRELAALGYNLGKIQADAERSTDLPKRWGESFLFAREDTERFVPQPGTGGMTCRLARPDATAAE